MRALLPGEHGDVTLRNLINPSKNGQVVKLVALEDRNSWTVQCIDGEYLVVSTLCLQLEESWVIASTGTPPRQIRQSPAITVTSLLIIPHRGNFVLNVY